MISRLRQLAELSPLQWWIILVAIFTLPMIALSLKLSGFKQTKKRMSRFSPNSVSDIPVSEDDISRARLISHSVAIAGNHSLFKANCLKQSLLLWWLLARRGITTEIQFGSQMKSEEDFGAHAWVELDGETIIDTPEIRQQFEVFK